MLVQELENLVCVGYFIDESRGTVKTLSTIPAVLILTGCYALKKIAREELYEYTAGEFSYQIKMLNGRILDTSWIYGKNQGLVEKASWIPSGSSQYKKFQKTTLVANLDTISVTEDTAKRSTESILKVIRRETPALRHVYNDFLRRHPGFKGRIFFRFSINAQGNISKILILENTSGNKDFALEILKRVSTWRFEPIENRNEDVITVPFTFSE